MKCTVLSLLLMSHAGQEKVPLEKNELRLHLVGGCSSWHDWNNLVFCSSFVTTTRLEQKALVVVGAMILHKCSVFGKCLPEYRAGLFFYEIEDRISS